MRHSAIHPAPTPTRQISGTPRELEILQKLARFDVLPSLYLNTNAYTPDILTDLAAAQMIGLPLGHGVVCRKCATVHPLSEEAWLYARQKNVYYPLSIWPRGETLLATRGLWHDRRKQSDSFDHKMFRSVVMHSFDFQESLEDVLREPWCPWVPVKDDMHAHRIPIGKDRFGKPYYLVPDEFVRVNDRFNAYIEIDNNTESIGTQLKDKLTMYVKHISSRGYNKRYGLHAITVIFYFNRKPRVTHFIELVEKVVPKELQQFFLAKYVSDFRMEYPPATDWAVTEPYECVGGTFTIPGARNVPRPESGESVRAGVSA